MHIEATPPTPRLRRPFLRLLLPFVLAALAGSARATTYWVATNGSDSNPGTSAQPFRTIQKGADLARAGDTVNVEAGTYSAGAMLRHSGKDNAWITLQRDPAAAQYSVLIDGGNFVSYGNSYIRFDGFKVTNTNYAFDIKAEPAARITGITVANNYTINTKGSGIKIFGTNNNNDPSVANGLTFQVLVDHNKVENACDGGGNECISVGNGVHHFEIRYNEVIGGGGPHGGEGIDIKRGAAYGSVHHNIIRDKPRRIAYYIDGMSYGVHDVDFHDNVGYNLGGCALAIRAEGWVPNRTGFVENVTVSNNLFYNGTKAGIVLDWAAKYKMPLNNIKVVNNTVYNMPHGIQLNNSLATNITLRNNVCYGSQNDFRMSNWGGGLVEDHNLVGTWSAPNGGFAPHATDLIGVDPRFVDPATGDFSLRADSPARNAGSSIGAPAADHAGVSRPQGSGVDLGAFEYPAEGGAGKSRRSPLVSGAASGTPSASKSFEGLRIAQDQYPRVFFFRSSEEPGKNPSLGYEEWESRFAPLMGIVGKALDEEIGGLSTRNIPFFTKFKHRHPEQMVLLHFNGNARDPRFESGRFFAGHWLYHVGSKILSDVPADERETDVKVADPALFRLRVGRYQDANDDIGLCSTDALGRPNWNDSEQVRLISIDPAKGIIRVQRGQYGTQPRQFAAGRSYAAPHVVEGPWGGAGNHIMWFYNYATAAPRDPAGRCAADILIDEFARRFGTGGDLAAFDGVEFDVLFFNRFPSEPRGPTGRWVDADADGKPDQARIGGINSYGIGVVEFCRALRERFPKEKVILADGMFATTQRAFGILNGIESEGFPQLGDPELKEWSSGINRHLYWARHAREPVFNYINHKFGPKVELPLRRHRLVFAAAALVDAAVCNSYAPKESDGRPGIWDEFRLGVENRLGWLGRPVAPVVHLAKRAPDLLNGEGVSLAPAFVARFSSDEVSIVPEGRRLRIEGKTSGAAQCRFRIDGLASSGPDLLISLTVAGASMKDYPPEIGRLLQVGRVSSRGPRLMTWAGTRNFDATFYFSDVAAGPVSLEFTVEGGEPLWISNITVHPYPDVLYREFEHGLVLANPARHSCAVDLRSLAPGKTLRRLRGSRTQDLVANNGGRVQGELRLEEREGLFLVRDE